MYIMFCVCLCVCVCVCVGVRVHLCAWVCGCVGGWVNGSMRACSLKSSKTFIDVLEISRYFYQVLECF
jgi:hypothetical protein